MARTIFEIAKDLRQQFNTLLDELEAEGFCTSRECMCDQSAPVVKLNAAIVELEQGHAEKVGQEKETG